MNGELLSESSIRARTSALRLEREAASHSLSLDERLALRDEALQLLIDRMLMLQEARGSSLVPSDAEVTAALERSSPRFDGVAGCRAGADTPESRQDVAERLMIDKLLALWQSSVSRPHRREAREYYRLHKQQFYQPPMAHAFHIVRHFKAGESEDDTRSQVEALRTRVSAGESFAAVAAAHSDCPENNGDLGWFHKGLMVTEFDDIIFKTHVDVLTPVFRTQFGFHFAYVYDRKGDGILIFDQVRQSIEDALWRVKRDREVGRKLAQLQAKAVIRLGA